MNGRVKFFLPTGEVCACIIIYYKPSLNWLSSTSVSGSWNINKSATKTFFLFSKRKGDINVGIFKNFKETYWHSTKCVLLIELEIGWLEKALFSKEYFGKTVERQWRKAIGTVKCQPAAIKIAGETLYFFIA